ncbi:MAG TPA: hypothetical protein PKE21_13175 [Flavobacteriales bacterium]|nr:hypothetical protein [Flavobacteriales bacterium]HMR28427.1 hypothetical protein [Flavobacteriales bacterium]
MRGSLCCLLALFGVIGSSAQSLRPEVIASGGDSNPLPNGGTLKWTIGQAVIGPVGWPTTALTQGFHQPDPERVGVLAKVFLDGPLVSGLMNDDLRTLPSFPLTEPYTGLGYTHIGSGFETVSPNVLGITGNNAIVDWVFLELRSASDNTVVKATAVGLLQRDGDVVALDGADPISFVAVPDFYYLVVRHRNHLAIMSANTISLGPLAVPVNFTNGTAATFGGTAAQRLNGGVRAMWAGDVTGNGQVKYTGGSNDRDPILVAIGGAVPTATVSGYAGTDVNLNGVTKYAGSANDRDVILTTVGGSVPTSTRSTFVP